MYGKSTCDQRRLSDDEKFIDIIARGGSSIGKQGMEMVWLYRPSCKPSRRVWVTTVAVPMSSSWSLLRRPRLCLPTSCALPGSVREVCLSAKHNNNWDVIAREQWRDHRTRRTSSSGSCALNSSIFVSVSWRIPSAELTASTRSWRIKKIIENSYKTLFEMH